MKLCTGITSLRFSLIWILLTGLAWSASVTVSPKRAAVVVKTQTQQFTSSNAGVTWSVDGVAGGNAAVGTISATGLYTPPATAGVHVVKATTVAAPIVSGTATVAVTDLAGVFTYHNDKARTGANSREFALTPATVTTATFGKLFSCNVDGAIYAQPLWVRGLSIAGGVHNVIFVATQHDSVYAFDADASPCITYWHAHLLDALHGGTGGEKPVVWNDVGNVGFRCFGDIYPEVGVTGTPVIDPGTNTFYVVSASEIPGPDSGKCAFPPYPFFHRLHALDLATGNERPNSPVTIAASSPGVGGVVTFSSQYHHNRSGLALANNTVYVAFAAHEDQGPYHGWLLGYNAADLTQPPSIFNTTPNGGSGGIWASGGAPAIDNAGDVYVVTGNGLFDALPLPSFYDYGDSILRVHPFHGITPNGVNLRVAGYFTPDDQAFLEKVDGDLGSGAAILLPDQTSGVGPKHLLAQTGKEGVVYLVDRDNMGQFNPSSNDQIVQSFPGLPPGLGLWGTPAWWQNNIYLGGQYDPIMQFAFEPATELFNPTVISQSAESFAFPGVTPSVSSRGATQGLVWALDEGLYGYASPNAPVFCSFVPVPAPCTGPAILHAYDATNLALEYWNSSMAANNRDRAGNAVKFVPPTIANGKVYVGTRTRVDIYGLLP
jgi:hypothetical protein